MSKAKLRGVLVCPDKHIAEDVTIEDTLDVFYDKLDCDTIDIVERSIGNKYFDIVCDDEALLKETPLPSALDKLNDPMLFGRLFVCHHNDEGELTSLSDDEVMYVLSLCQTGTYIDYASGKRNTIIAITRVGY